MVKLQVKSTRLCLLDQVDLRRGGGAATSKSSRWKQVKMGQMIMMLMMIILAAVVNFSEAKHNQQSNQQQSKGSGSRSSSSAHNLNLLSTDQCSIQKQYRPEGPIGIRYKKQILQGRDMRAEVQDSHMIEAALKKRHFLQMFGLEDQSMIEEDFQLQQLCPSFLYHSQLLQDDGGFINIEQRDAFCGEGKLGQESQEESTHQNAFLSTHFYKPKYLHVQSVSKPQEAFAQGGIQIQLQQPGDQHPKQQDVPKDNSYLNLALNVLPSYELPVQALDAMDHEQTIEGFLFKKAKQTNVDNFNMFKQVFSEQDPRLGTLEMFQRNSFTYEDPKYIANLTNGMKPNQIQQLKPQSSVYRYFTQEVEITPQRTSFEECQLLIPKFEIIKIQNKYRNKSIEIKTMIASSPELTFYPPNDLEFPIKLKPQESIDIKVAYISETLGLFEAIMYIALDDWIFISTFNAYVVPNVYEIYPFYVTDINVNQSIELELHVTNPSSTDTLIIEELYSTEQDVKLKWPHTSHPISSHPDSADGDSVISHILVPEGGRKHLVNMVFEINRTMDFYVEIHIRTSLHDVLRVPLYYHVHSDVIKFTPNVIDFGLTALNFDMLKIPIYARSKIQDPLIIQDILLPLGDQRLDFQMTDFQKAPNSQIIRRNKDLFLGYALINPVSSGLIESKIQVIVLGQRTNKTYVLDVPIIGFVHPSANIFGSNQVLNGQDSSLNYPLPLVQFDLSDHIIQQANQIQSTTGKEVPPSKRKVNDSPNLKNAILQTPLILKNNFKVPIKLKGIVNQNPEFRVILENTNHYHRGLILQPGESVNYAQVELTTSLLKITQGNKYISIIVNNTLIPVSISMFDRGLLCVWDENEQSIGLDDIPFCTNAHEVNFDYVALNDIKMKRLKITNINPVNVTIEQVAKQQLDDLNIYIEKVVDRNGHQISIQNADLAGETMQSIIGAKRTKRLINFIIQPYQTMQLVLQILAKDPKQKFSRIDFSLKDGSSKDFSFNYKYHAIAGTLIMVPQILKFNPSYPGMSQTRPLVARSTFEVPITVKTITSNDMRIIPTVQPVAIRPNNKTEFGALQFDSSKQPILNNLPIPHLGGPQGLPFNNQDIATILSQHLSSFDPMMQQNLMNFLNGIGGAPGNIQQQLPNPNIAMINIPHRSSVNVNQVIPMMTPQDIELFREKERLWEDTSSQNVGGSITMVQNAQVKEVTTYVTIETNVYQNITIPIRAQIRKPILTDSVINQEQTQSQSTEEQGQQHQGAGIQAEVIDFDYVQVGTSQYRNLKVINPTDEPFFFTLLLTTNENYKKLLQTDKISSAQQKKGPLPQDKDFYFQLFCLPKFGTISDKEDASLPNDLNLSAKENFIVACKKIQHILKSIENKRDNDEKVLTLRRRLEAYLKDLFTLEVQQDQQMAIEKNQKQNMFQGDRNSFQLEFLQDEDLTNITNLINQLSRARPLDQETLNIYRATYEKQQKMFAEIQQLGTGGSSFFSSLPDFQTMIASSWNLIQQVILSRQQQLHQKPQNATQKQKKQALPTPSAPYYRLNNILLNDLIIHNETSRLLKDRIQLIDPFVCSYTGQSFFVNPRYQGQVYRVDPRSMLTLKDAVIFQPQSLVNQTSFDMKLILKNNLTSLHAIDLRGKSGSGFLEIVKVLKKAPPISGISQDYYINAHMMYGSTGLPLFNEIQANYIDYTNLSTNLQSQQQIRERLSQNIFTSRIHEDGQNSASQHLQQRELLIRAANYHRMSGQNSASSAAAAAFLMNNGAYGGVDTPIELNTVPFHLGQEDILIPIQEEDGVEANGNTESGGTGTQSPEETEYDEENEYIIVNRILERAAAAAAAANNPDSDSQSKTRIQIQTYHKRVLVVQNTGNLPLNVEMISLEDRGCKAQNFIIENCHPFVLKPGETHRIHIGFKTDFTLAKFKRKLILVAKQGVIQEYILDVNIPVEHLKLANDLMPLTSVEEWQQLFLKLAILAVAFTTFIQVALDVFGHLKFTQQLIPDHEDTIQFLEEHHNFNLPLFKTGTSQQVYKRDFQQTLPPVIREYIPHDQVYHLYQQAQDKLQDNRVTNQKGSQLLLKEVANLCSNKRQLVTVEAQKQAIKFDQESRKVINARNQMYIKEMKELQAASQAQAKLQQQPQVQAKEVQPPIITNYYQTQQQPQLQQSQPMVSVTSDNSLNESINDPHTSLNTRQLEESKGNQNSTPKANQTQQKQFLISKKLKKEIAQRQKEHQEAEERFKQQQKLKEIQEAANRQRQLELEEVASRIKAQEEERRLKEEQQKQTFKVEVLQTKIVPQINPTIVAPIQGNVRHHDTEFEKRQMTQKLENKSLNTPSKEDSSASQIYLNSQRSPSNSSEIETSLISNPEKAVAQSIFISQDQPVVKFTQDQTPQILKKRNQQAEILNLKPAQKTEAKINQKLPKEGSLKVREDEKPYLKKLKPTSPPVVEVDLRPEINKEEEPALQKLTKEDLQPFFEQQPQDKKQETKNPSTLHSPLLGANSSNFFGGSSIFSFNPLNAFSGTGSQNQTPDTQANKQRPPQITNPLKLSSKPDFNNTQNAALPSEFGNQAQDNKVDQNQEEEDEEEEEDDFEANQSADFYNLFNTARSLLARPSFGSPSTQSTGPKFLQRIKSSQGEKKKQNESFSQRSSQIQESRENDDDPIIHDNINNKPHEAQGSLFSGSLFGESNIFGSTNQTKKQGNFNVQQNHMVRDQQLSSFIPQSQNMHNNNAWSSSKPFLPQAENTFGPQGSDLGSIQASQASAALIRNQQQVYPEIGANYTGQLGGNNMIGYQSQNSYSSMNYQFTPQPPPGLGYKPSAQGQSLYAQYSSGFNQNQQAQVSSGGIARVNSHHYEGGNNSGKINTSYGNFTGGNSSGSNSLHYSQSYPNQSLYGPQLQLPHQNQSHSNQFTPPKVGRVNQHQQILQPTNFHPSYNQPQKQQQQPPQWPQNPHLQGGIIQPPPGLPLNGNFQSQAKHRNMMNSSSFFLIDDNQGGVMNTQSDEDVPGREINSYRQNMKQGEKKGNNDLQE